VGARACDRIEGKEFGPAALIPAFTRARADGCDFANPYEGVAQPAQARAQAAWRPVFHILSWFLGVRLDTATESP
jgi:hypothetical protein